MVSGRTLAVDEIEARLEAEHDRNCAFLARFLSRCTWYQRNCIAVYEAHEQRRPRKREQTRLRFHRYRSGVCTN
jgi:hypothetical protein